MLWHKVKCKKQPAKGAEEGPRLAKVQLTVSTAGWRCLCHRPHSAGLSLPHKLILLLFQLQSVAKGPDTHTENTLCLGQWCIAL